MVNEFSLAFFSAMWLQHTARFEHWDCETESARTYPNGVCYSCACIPIRRRVWILIQGTCVVYV